MRTRFEMTELYRAILTHTPFGRRPSCVPSGLISDVQEGSLWHPGKNSFPAALEPILRIEETVDFNSGHRLELAHIRVLDTNMQELFRGVFRLDRPAGQEWQEWELKLYFAAPRDTSVKLQGGVWWRAPGHNQSLWARLNHKGQGASCIHSSDMCLIAYAGLDGLGKLRYTLMTDGLRPAAFRDRWGLGVSRRDMASAVLMPNLMPDLADRLTVEYRPKTPTDHPFVRPMMWAPIDHQSMLPAATRVNRVKRSGNAMTPMEEAFYLCQEDYRFYGARPLDHKATAFEVKSAAFVERLQRGVELPTATRALKRLADRSSVEVLHRTRQRYASGTLVCPPLVAVIDSELAKRGTPVQTQSPEESVPEAYVGLGALFGVG